MLTLFDGVCRFHEWHSLSIFSHHVHMSTYIPLYAIKIEFNHDALVRGYVDFSAHLLYVSCDISKMVQDNLYNFKCWY